MKKIAALLCLLGYSYVLFAQKTFDISSSDLVFKFQIEKNNILKERLLLPSTYMGNIILPETIDQSDLPVSLQLSGTDRPSHHGIKLAGGMPGLTLKYDKKEEQEMAWGKRVKIFLKEDEFNLQIVSCYDFYQGTNTCRRYTQITNNGSKNADIEFLSSAMINNIGNLGKQTLEDKIQIHWAKNSWKAEGQWRTESPSQEGWGANGIFQLSGIFHSSIGSMSTVQELPMAMIENKETGLIWFWQIEHNGAWHWEFSNVQSPKNYPTLENSSPTYVYLGGPDEQHHQAWKTLKPGETYQTVPVAIGCVKGGFDAGVAALTKYRRKALLSANKDNVDLPVIFNDYMNCLFGDPTTAKEIPLINAAAKVGCDYFVVDAGWYAEQNETWWDAVGLWMPGKSRFPNGIEEVLDSIKAKKMVPGLWLEIERVGINSPLKDKPDTWFFMRHGKRVMDHKSFFLDFRNPEVIDYATKVIDRLVKTYGAGYIKMDYNANALMGTETQAESFGQGILAHQRAYLSWIKKMYLKYPELVIENCGSGGVRMDYAMLAVHQLQSSSDQTDYKKYPSILVGEMAAVLPEQLAVWSYPLKNGNKYEAAFNMVNSMLCRIHQSGHLAELQPESLDQIKNGIAIYKKELAPVIPKAIPFFPLGFTKISDILSPAAVGLESEKADYYAVWRLAGSENVSINIKNKGKAEILYPIDLGVKITQSDKSFTINFPQKYNAVIIKVNK
ncbi:alpha-galactosidase [Pedobacter sp. MW01-1-1]|uniref:alpha-galactosidase n=1 Tax=Pedobacter sp. MW01-1-1 TaxID=3383027 RepID=UPI003FED4984